MEKVHFSTKINASKERVWNTMLDDETYREWTSAFFEGSYYEGSWEQGSAIRFMGPDRSGMVSRIADNRLHEFVSIEHLGFTKNGVDDMESEGAAAFSGARENYTFKEGGGVTELSVEMDIPDAYRKMFEDTWPKALLKLKQLSER
ncbi:MAG TPA: SRPBCC domain-containing protein [Thermoanaerobaculia bacterium]|nr:SRPBCC domain-containing protein [Thermoanaerobaculia bacterium]